MVAGEAVAAEDGAANDGLEQIVGEAHTAEDAEMMEYSADTLEGIPGQHVGHRLVIRQRMGYLSSISKPFHSSPSIV